MKNSSQKREQNEKKKEALNEYLEALKVVDYWTGKVRELNGAFIYRSPSSNTELPTKAIGNPTVSVSMEMETAEENERETDNPQLSGQGWRGGSVRDHHAATKNCC